LRAFAHIEARLLSGFRAAELLADGARDRVKVWMRRLARPPDERGGLDAPELEGDPDVLDQNGNEDAAARSLRCFGLDPVRGGGRP
jgi:hypothetical protein